MGWALFLLFWLLVHIHGCFGCLEKEKNALLELKTSVSYSNESAIPSWEDGTDCCRWKGVKCDITIGHVTDITVHEARESYEEGDWYLNEEIFLSFEELRLLDLSGIRLHGWLHNEGCERWPSLSKLELLDLSLNSFNESILSCLQFPYLKRLYLSRIDLETSYKVFERLSSLSKLEHLDLSECQIDNHIIPYLVALTSLRSLDLSNNDLEGLFNSTDLERLSSLSKLEHLDLSWCQIDNYIIPYLVALTSLRSLDLSYNGLEGLFNSTELVNLSKLEVLKLEGNGITRFVPPSAETLTSLQALSLSGNQLNGSSMLKGFCTLNNLQELDLSINHLQGSIPPCFSNFSSLQLLDLSHNQLSGCISTTLITSFTMLQFFSISGNYFGGSISFSSFGNLSKLEYVNLRATVRMPRDLIWEEIDPKNKTSQLEIETEYPWSWTPTFQLKFLGLSNCINNQSRIVPSFLRSQHDLRLLDLSYNNITGNFPSWLLENNERLKVLNLMGNSLTGPFDVPSHRNMWWLDISNNHMNGQLHEDIGLLLPNLKHFNASTNSLNSNIPPSIGFMSELMYLDLSENKFAGEIPEALAMGCISLVTLKLSNNMLRGPSFPKYSNLARLNYLYLDENHFTGTISASMFESPNLKILDISDNYISGSLPPQIGNMSHLDTLVMRRNNLSGPIPIDYCKLNDLYILDLSENNISGSLPSCIIGNSSMNFLHVRRNVISSLAPNAPSKVSQLITLDVSYNQISGTIPEWIGTLSSLTFLLLKGNRLHGQIPTHLCQLNKIAILDLSSNHISGRIPSCFSNITFGRGLNFQDDDLINYWVTSSQVVYKTKTRIGKTEDLFVYLSRSTYQEKVEFITKWRTETYRGNILSLMFGMDLSCNQLRGEIPPEMGQLSNLHALNLSHNLLTGKIPKTFSNLTEIESLDLSYNRLSGSIPNQLTLLYRISTFSVAYNNLSGRTPDMKAQFATFNESSYEGNPLLCGPPLKSCLATSPVPISMPTTSDEERDYNRIIFFATLVGSHVVSFLAFMAILYINRYWRARYFAYMDACIDSCYYFVLDNVDKLFHRCN